MKREVNNEYGRRKEKKDHELLIGNKNRNKNRNKNSNRKMKRREYSGVKKEGDQRSSTHQMQLIELDKVD